MLAAVGVVAAAAAAAATHFSWSGAGGVSMAAFPSGDIKCFTGAGNVFV